MRKSESSGNPSDPKPFRILVVCTGNICRSPTAEIMLRHKAAAKGMALEVSSAGTSGLTGQPMTTGAAQALRDRGYDPAGHQARNLRAAMVSGADLVLVMTDGHRQDVLARHPDAGPRVATMKAFAGGSGDVEDPYGGGPGVYAGCAAELDALCDRVLTRLQGASAIMPS